MSLFSELEPSPHLRKALEAQAKLARQNNPCAKCALATIQPKILPVIPSDPVLVVVAAAPSANDEREGRPFSGREGEQLRAALAEAGLDVARVGFAHLTRCRPPTDDLRGPWEQAEKQCRRFLDADLVGSAPLMLLGAAPLKSFVGGKTTLGAQRGLWSQADERDVFSARDPRQLLRVQDVSARETLLGEFRDDVGRMADRLLDREPASPITAQIFETPFAAADFLQSLAQRAEPWAFDLETYDGAVFPSRVNVSTDPCHPDFRLRGVAIALSATEGAWIDCRFLEPRIAEVRALLSPAFESPAEKWAWFGHFDEEGLTYPGWVTRVSCRAGDGGLALLALSDGAHESLRLEHAVVNVLGARQYWNGMDKGKMRDVSLEVVAANAVGDACYTFALCEKLHGMLERGEYMVHKRIE